jgi:hypothetical protein
MKTIANRKTISTVKTHNMLKIAARQKSAGRQKNGLTEKKTGRRTLSTRCLLALPKGQKYHESPVCGGEGQCLREVLLHWLRRWTPKALSIAKV